MSVRKDRQDAILSIIGENEISTQDELILKLLEKGFSTTQATISRDIKELNIIKRVNENGKSFYHVNSADSRLFATKTSSILTDSVLSIDSAMNMCVIHTHVGMAGAACASIDSINWDGIVGTIAGDDTIFVVCRTESKAKNFCEALSKKLGK